MLWFIATVFAVMIYVGIFWLHDPIVYIGAGIGFLLASAGIVFRLRWSKTK